MRLLNTQHAVDFRYKNFKCVVHNKFFEVNLYQKDPVNSHHWRANIARPSDEIDLDTKRGGQSSTTKNTLTKAELDKRLPDPALNTDVDSQDLEPIARVVESAVKPDTYSSSQSTTRVDDTHFSNNSDHDFEDFEGGYGSERSAKDFAACNSDCGYCGHCDY